MTSIEVNRAALERAANELLTHLEEEAAEVIQACTKLRRFGPESTHPDLPRGLTNIEQLCFEIGQFWQTVDVVLALRELGGSEVLLFQGRRKKWDYLVRELRHLRLSLDATGDLVARLRTEDADPVTEPGEKEKDSGASHRTQGDRTSVPEPENGPERDCQEHDWQGSEEAPAAPRRAVGAGADHDDSLWG